jgi:pimeloyl-ACP methyl ester carboxylesterase
MSKLRPPGDASNQRMSFSWNDLSEHDMRASLQKVANVTDKAGSIIYVGHSRGTLLMFMFASEFPKEANQLIQGTIFLCPVAYLDLVWYLQASMRPLSIIGVNKLNAFSILKTLPTQFQKLLKQFKISSLFGNIESTAHFFQHFCTFFPYLCRWGINLATGKTNQFLAVNPYLIFRNLKSTPLFRTIC